MNFVPISPTVLKPFLIMACAVTSAIWRIGFDTLFLIASTVLCIVFEHIIVKSAPAASTLFIASAMILANSSQLSSSLRMRIGSRSTEYITHLHECCPPSFLLTSSLMILYTSAEDCHASPPMIPIVFIIMFLLCLRYFICLRYSQTAVELQIKHMLHVFAIYRYVMCDINKRIFY